MNRLNSTESADVAQTLGDRGRNDGAPTSPEPVSPRPLSPGQTLDAHPVLPAAGISDRERLELQYLKSRRARSEGLDRLVGTGSKMTAVLTAIQNEVRQGALLTPLMLRGETGTGKTSVAHAIHHATRPEGPLIDFDCAGGDDLAYLELFGPIERSGDREHQEGLWSLAAGGTLVIDGIDCLPLTMQRRILTWLLRRPGSAAAAQNQRVQLVATTHRDLEFMVQQGLFSRELMLSFATIFLPPLRERGADVIALAEHFLARFARRYRQPPKRLSKQARNAIQRYQWPANVRELRSTIELVVLVEDDPVVSAHHLCLRDERIGSGTGDGGLRLGVAAVPANVLQLNPRRARRRTHSARCKARGNSGAPGSPRQR